ncbi:MAG: hypothetical protein LBQ61_03640 [Spirochaetales bacterium]|jgi:hypothetical protein|nr:hypothetical protein [Spirochaetales bacterium]
MLRGGTREKEMARQMKETDRHGDRRKVRGALAGAIMHESVRSYAIKKGLYVIVQTGDTVRIDIPEGFQPGEWQGTVRISCQKNRSKRCS